MGCLRLRGQATAMDVGKMPCRNVQKGSGFRVLGLGFRVLGMQHFRSRTEKGKYTRVDIHTCFFNLSVCPAHALFASLDP